MEIESHQKLEIELSNQAKLECFTHIFQNLKTFTELINVQFTETGMSIQGLDSSHVSIFVVSIPANWFDLFRASSVTLGINTHILCKILFAREKTQKIRMEVCDEKEDTLFISFTGADSGSSTAGVISGSIDFDRQFEMPLVDVDQELLQIPEIEYCAELSLLSGKMQAVVNQLKNFGDTMEISCTEDNIKMNSTSPHTGKMSVDVKIDELLTYSIDEGESLKAFYSLQYMSNICQFHKISKEVHISLSPDFPMQVSYSMGGGSSMKFYLAPKISNDD
jgi:proliferating cell nuclear antigen